MRDSDGCGGGFVCGGSYGIRLVEGVMLSYVICAEKCDGAFFGSGRAKDIDLAFDVFGE
jgi:hypothetical protein